MPQQRPKLRPRSNVVKLSWFETMRKWGDVSIRHHKATLLYCKCSQLHMSVKHDHEHERTEHLMPRLQPTTTPRTVGALQQSHPGLCGTLVGPGKDTHGTPVPDREGRGWPKVTSTRRPTTTRQKQTLSQMCFQETGVVIDLEESYMYGGDGLCRFFFCLGACSNTELLRYLFFFFRKRCHGVCKQPFGAANTLADPTHAQQF